MGGVKSLRLCTRLVHNGAMKSQKKVAVVRQSVSMPTSLAARVKRLAKSRKLSSNKMVVELIENGIQAEASKQQKFFDLAEKLRNTTDDEEAKRIGDEIGRMIFGG